MATRADQPPAALGIDKILPHRVHVCLVGIMALQAERNFVVSCQQAGVIRRMHLVARGAVFRSRFVNEFPVEFRFVVAIEANLLARFHEVV
jgi:hypothetical protein